jgi:ElaB/YqjD/DUF883 family membrane-anchored ribosome-binding protein
MNREESEKSMMDAKEEEWDRVQKTIESLLGEFGSEIQWEIDKSSTNWKIKVSKKGVQGDLIEVTERQREDLNSPGSSGREQQEELRKRIKAVIEKLDRGEKIGF